MHQVKVLIVDDNVPTRYGLRRRLEHQGLVITEAGTGAAGLALIAEQQFDAVILDINLPDISGIDVVRQLRADPATALLPVVQISATSIHADDIVTGLEAGADAYLIYPIDPYVLLATLRTLFRVRDVERALRESEARFQEIFTNVAAPIAVIDGELRVVESNDAFALLLPHGPSQDSWLAGIAHAQGEIIAELQLHLRQGERWHGSVTLEVEGIRRETQWQVSPYRAPGHSLVFVEDITEHRERDHRQLAMLEQRDGLLAREVAERARVEENLLQVQKMDALGKLTGGIAHDFNNLLTGIITSLELIMRRVAASDSMAPVVATITRYAEAALSSATSAAALTHRMLAFARQQPLDSQAVDINEHVRSLEDLLRRTIGENITLHMGLAADQVIAIVDPIQFESAMLNLVINARDALPYGGNIYVSTIAMSSLAGADLEAGEYVALSIRDDGVGIEQNIIDKVFDPFFTTKAVGKGTGLGLSMIYGFARQSGGNVHITSTVGLGTEVTFVLPKAQVMPLKLQDGLAQTKQLESFGAGEHILVVDDIPSVRMFVIEALMDRGYRCSAAESAAAALLMLNNDPSIDLILTDVGLPEMTGRELADEARLQRPELPILLMTGYAENAPDLKRFLASRMDLILKPFRMAELLERVERLLGPRS